MEKLRSISTKIWCDPWFEDLSSSQKLLFIYLITNDRTNMLGVYEVSIKKIAFETSLTSNQIKDFLSEFEKAKKVKYVNNHIILFNFLKNQKFNPNMKKSAIDIYNNVLTKLEVDGLEVIKSRGEDGFQKVCKGFERVYKGFGMVRKIEVEVEVEIEEEMESEIKVEIPYVNIIDFLNDSTGRKYRAVEKTKKLIKERFKQGFCFDDFKLVITNKTKDWLSDPKMSEYLRPETLFGNKFASYLAKAEVAEKEDDDNYYKFVR